jgi:hypothetical protein
MEQLFSWEVSSVLVVFFIGFGQRSVDLENFPKAKLCFLFAAADAMGGVVMWVARTGLQTLSKYALIFVVTGLIGVLAMHSWLYVEGKKEEKRKPKPSGNSSLPENRFPTSGEIAEDLAKKLREDEASHLQPMVKRGSPFIAQIPFTVYLDSWNTLNARVPLESFTIEDPLRETYAELGQYSSINLGLQEDPKTRQIIDPKSAITDAEITYLLGCTLQYYILHFITETGDSVQAINQEFKDGRVTVTPAATVAIPDSQEYSRSRLLKLLPEFKLPYANGDQPVVQ